MPQARMVISTGMGRPPAGLVAERKPAGHAYRYGRRIEPAGLRYADTDMDTSDTAHAGASLIARVGVTL